MLAWAGTDFSFRKQETPCYHVASGWEGDMEIWDQAGPGDDECDLHQMRSAG